MCGIAGFVGAAPGVGGAGMEALATRMGDAIAHRGPDDAGSWADPGAGIALTSRRLAIVDLSAAGHQPMVSQDGRFRLVFNGEIYNHLDLRDELEASGVRFRGRSDTEILLEAIARWGLQRALAGCAGMFAFALWDAGSRTLTLARDRMGEKPLYYGWQGGSLLFGSELKALRRHPAWRGEIDRDALALFMRYGYVPGPFSIFRGIRSLRPGCTLTLGPSDVAAGEPGLPAPVPYWSLLEVARNGIDRPFRGDEVQAADELERRLTQAVRGQMIADVPLGAFLSGGIDSSVVVALMQQIGSEPARTFTIGFREAEHDESAHARAVARHLGTRHEELLVTPDEAMAAIPRMAAIYDEPFADPSQVPTFLVAQLARRHVTVSLSGDGGDELFGGYNRYVWARNAWRALSPLPLPLRRAAAGIVRSVPQRAWGAAFRALGPLAPRIARRAGAGERVHRLAAIGTFRDVHELYRRLVSLWDEPERLVRGAHGSGVGSIFFATPAAPDHAGCSRCGETMTPDPISVGGPDPAWRDLVEQLSYLDGVTYLPDDILVKVDRAAMAVSLETRVPLLDHRVVELAWSLPPAMKVGMRGGKLLLKRVLARHVPPALTDRPKSGFGLPIDTWLRGGLREWAESLLSRERLEREGYLDADLVRATWSEHLAGRHHHYRLWAVLMWQAWLEEWG